MSAHPSRWVLKYLQVFLSFICLTGFAWASGPHLSNRFDEALITDRPDSAEASQTVGRLRFQLETSFAFGQDREGASTSRTVFFPTLLRFGIVHPVELRVETPMYTIQSRTDESTQSGRADLDIGFKTHLLENEGWVPSLGLLAHIGTPTGKDSLSSNAVEPKFKILSDWKLPKDFSLGTNVGVDFPARDSAGDKYARLLYAVVFNHPTPFLKEQMRIFVEATGTVPMKTRKNDEHILDTGLAFLIAPDMQLDSFVQLGVSEVAPGLQTGLGFSWRL